MATSKEYLQFILDQLSDLDNISYRPMMGEYIICYRGKIAAYICDDRLLIKPVKAAIGYMPNAAYAAPYESAKDMLLAEDVDDKDFLTGLFNAIYDELPEPKKSAKKKK